MQQTVPLQTRELLQQIWGPGQLLQQQRHLPLIERRLKVAALYRWRPTQVNSHTNEQSVIHNCVILVLFSNNSMTELLACICSTAHQLEPELKQFDICTHQLKIASGERRTYLLLPPPPAR